MILQMYQRNNLNLDKNSKDQLDYFLNKIFPELKN